MELILRAVAAVDASDEVWSILGEWHSSAFYKCVGHTRSNRNHRWRVLEDAGQKTRAILIGECSGVFLRKCKALCCGIVVHDTGSRHGRKPLTNIALLQPCFCRSLGYGKRASSRHGFE